MRDLASELKNIKRQICCLADLIQSGEGGGGEEFTLFTENTPTVNFSGAGTEEDPLIAESITEVPIQNGIISGGEVTWISGYTYSVSPAIYYINGIRYEFEDPIQITLDPADATLNRIDVFALTTDNTAVDITGTPSTNPEQPSINTSTQLITSFALVVAGTTSPSPSVSQEYIYRENAGTPTEWAASATGGIVVNSVSNPNAGTTDIEGTSVAAGNTITLIRTAASNLAATKNVLVFYIRSKATWNNNRILTFQFKNGVTNIGIGVPFSNTNSYGFASGTTGIYQRVVIPFSDFGLTPSDSIDRLVITASGNGGSLGFYIDDIETQGANLLNTPTGITDNVGVFYVSKNYSGIGGAVVSGYTIAAITSINAGYNTQLLAARMGNMNKAYPCPWSARNAAMTAITAGTITKAYIRVLGGSEWTIGNILASGNGGKNEGNVITASLTPTIPDVAFSGLTDISSLLKNKIDYFFEENSAIYWINRSGALHLGYNLDATHTEFKSGVYGKGDFIQVFDETPTRGPSHRGFRIDNARSEINFEGRTLIFNGFFGVLATYKSVNISFDTVYTTKRGSITGQTNVAGENSGDGKPSTLTVYVKNLYQGHDYYPYISTHVTTSYQPFFAIDYSSATRQKNQYYKVTNYFAKTNALHVVMNAFVTSGNRDCYNNFIQLDIDLLRHEIDLVDQAVATSAGALIQPISHGTTTSHVRDNHHVVVNIKKAIVDHSLVSIRLIGPTHASSRNSSVTINVDYVYRNYKIANIPLFVGIENIFTLPYLHPVSSGIILGEKVNVQFNIGQAIARYGNVFGNSNVSPMIYGANTIISGAFVTEDGSPVIILQGANDEAAFLKDAVLVAKGAATNTIEIDNGALPVSIYTKDTVANLPYEAGITQQGVLTVDANITNYL